MSCCESFGNKVDAAIGGFFAKVGRFTGRKPRLTILLTVVLAVIAGSGLAFLETENRPEELWVPQETIAETETERFQSLYPPSARVQNLIVSHDENVLTKSNLQEIMELHNKIVEGQSTTEEVTYDLFDLCSPGGGTCQNRTSGGNICSCLISSVLRVWNYDSATLEADGDVLATLQTYGSQDDLRAVLGNAQFSDSDGALVSADAVSITYFLQNRQIVADGSIEDPINEEWEDVVFLAAAEEGTESLSVEYFATRSFGDEFGGAITGDLLLVNVSYVVAFLFLGATLGRIKCGPGSRWTMSLAALATVALSTIAGFGISSYLGLFFGPVHSLLPFVLLGIGVDDAFVIVNAFNRELKVARSSEDNDSLAVRAQKSLARAGASISVTSATDLVAFAISSSSGLPALSSFCAYAAISIFFLWFLASTFFTACLVLDERRQRDNRRECLCCVSRRGTAEEQQDTSSEGRLSVFFRENYCPAILSKPGKAVVLLGFAGLLGFGVFGALNLSVEDSERQFIPAESYLNDYIAARDEYFTEQGVTLNIIFEDSSSIFSNRVALSQLDERLTGLSQSPPFISEPISEEAYRNVMAGLSEYLVSEGTGSIGGADLGDDNWPTSEADFVSTLVSYASVTGPGARFAQDISYDSDTDTLEAFRVKCEYVKLLKTRRGEQIDDSDKLIEAMDSTRELIDSWTDLEPVFPYSEKFISIEGFKVIRQELFLNVGLAIGAVGIIVFFTVASPVTAIIITLNVAAAVIEILGFMYAVGLVIDSVSVINIVLAVGLSVDYSAHVGHCFMVKGGDNKDRRATEALADIGAAVLSGATSTFLAVAVLLFSSSYVFQTLSRQFALTVLFGIIHGLVLLPVLLALFGPQPFASAEPVGDSGSDERGDDDLRKGTFRTNNKNSDSSSNEDAAAEKNANADEMEA